MEPAPPDSGTGIERLLEIMRRLRDPVSGCPWDIRQDLASIAPYTVEEAHEVADAIRRNDLVALRDELGDLLLQVVYHARMAEEAGEFTFADVVASISDKMVRRHPHVFSGHGGEAPFGPREWDRQKRQEHNTDMPPPSALDGAAHASAPLARATTLGIRAARCGFDWQDIEGVRVKVAEELTELNQASDREHQREEFGDLLFALASLARHMNLDAESALRCANQKFERRFRAMEQRLADTGQRFEELDEDALEALWQSVKSEEVADESDGAISSHPAT